MQKTRGAAFSLTVASSVHVNVELVWGTTNGVKPAMPGCLDRVLKLMDKPERGIITIGVTANG